MSPAFPWDLLGYTQINNIPLTRIASVTGVYGLSFEIALVNTVVTAAFLVPRRKRASLLDGFSCGDCAAAGWEVRLATGAADYARRNAGAVQRAHPR